MVIAVDFDGTIVEHRYPAIGKERPFAIEVLKQLAAEGNRIILWTSREGNLLEEAVAFCRERGLEFYAVNSEVPADSLFAKSASNRHKISADIFIDDHNLGGLPDWGEIYEMVTRQRFERKQHRSRRRWRLFGKR